MENRKAYYKVLIHVVCCVIIILVFVLTTMRVSALSVENKYYNDIINVNKFKSLTNNNITEVINNKYDTPRIIENDIYNEIEKKKDIIDFFSKMFGFDSEFIKQDLIERNMDVSKIEKNNLGRLKNNDELKEFPNEEYGLSEYFFEISELHPEKRTNKYLPYAGNSEYIEKLIIYYTNIYVEVDTILALSIGAAESGYYQVNYMLEKNNVFGGMGKNGLIVYENIEIGVLKYIRLLSNGYFKMGLTTKETIGRKYCPQYDSNGNKVASPHWINLVSKAENKYKDYVLNIEIEDLNE